MTMSAQVNTQPDLLLSLESRPERVAVVRRAISGLAAPRLPRDVVERARLAVSEAVNNVVRHAYGTEIGGINIALRLRDDGLDAMVRDAGKGFDPEVHGPGDGVGLTLMDGLANAFAYEADAGGTTVSMRFETVDDDTDVKTVTLECPSPAGLGKDEIVIALQSGQPATALESVIALVAAQVDLPLDRVGDARTVVDAITALAADGGLQGDQLTVALGLRERAVQLEAGPFVAERLRQELDDQRLPGLGAVLARLAPGAQSAGDGAAAGLLRLVVAGA
jgi:anti-sigma regulatory factor (Ser/Thr protein kinase)